MSEPSAVLESTPPPCPRSPGSTGSPRSTGSTGSTGSPAGQGDPDLRRALRELAAIHRAEQALLLSQAAELGLRALERRPAVGAAPGMRAAATPFPLLGPALEARSESVWRAELSTARNFARADGVPFAAALEELHRELSAGVSLHSLGADPERVARWALEALALEAWPESHLTLARVHLASGAADAAECELDGIERTAGIDWSSAPSRRLRAALIGVRAACAEWRGECELALERFLEQFGLGGELHPALMIVALALVTGDRRALGRGTRALAALERRSSSEGGAPSRARTEGRGVAAGAPADWPRLAARLRARVARVGPRPGFPAFPELPVEGARARRLFDVLCHADPWSARVARALLGD